MSIAASLVALVADPAWLGMDATARGFHVQLLVVAAQRKPAGTLGSNEATLRRYIGLPSNPPKKPHSTRAVGGEDAQAKAISKLLVGADANIATLLGAWWAAAGEETAPEDGARSLEAWQEHLWQTRWRPMVMAGWQRIDESLIDEHPRLAKSLGGYYSAIAESWSRLQEPGEAAGKTANAPKKARVKRLDGVKITPVAIGPDDTEMAWMGQDVNRWHNPDDVLGRWRMPLDEDTKKSLWDVGVGALAGTGASPTDRARAKALLGKLIKSHGEERVAEAVANLSTRPIQPADPGAFLAGLLRNKEEGTPAEQKARNGRARVAL
jgi:hypothetical protein